MTAFDGITVPELSPMSLVCVRQKPSSGHLLLGDTIRDARTSDNGDSSQFADEREQDMRPPPRIITLREAKMLGRKTYFTGEPCQHGHVCERFVKRQWCRECARVGIKPGLRPCRT
jgi:hypothetical protein